MYKYYLIFNHSSPRKRKYNLQAAGNLYTLYLSTNAFLIFVSSSLKRPLAVVTTLFIIGARLSFRSFVSGQVACKRLGENARILAA
jgi:hypothetical protein